MMGSHSRHVPGAAVAPASLLRVLPFRERVGMEYSYIECEGSDKKRGRDEDRLSHVIVIEQTAVAMRLHAGPQAHDEHGQPPQVQDHFEKQPDVVPCLDSRIPHQATLLYIAALSQLHDGARPFCSGLKRTRDSGRDGPACREPALNR